VIFGGSGDLAHRKLLPALYNLHVDRLLPPKFAVVGVGRKEMSDDAYRAFAKDGVKQFSRRPIDEAAWETFARTLCFVNMSLDDAGGFATLGARLDSVEHAGGLTGDRLYYLAIPPALFAPTVKQLARSRMVARASQRAEPFARIIVEKPIGHDLQSAQTINDALAEVFDEEQIYRIDHYLGKETVQNILVLRFANSIFEPLFNLKFIDHVQITVAEAEGVGTRAGYYEQRRPARHDPEPSPATAGADRDGTAPRAESRSHPRRETRNPAVAAADGRPRRRWLHRACAVRELPEGAWRRSRLADRDVRGAAAVHRQLAMGGVPFFLRTGKKMTKRASEIAIQLKDIPPILFNADPAHRLTPNVLSIRIQPDEGFSIEISSKEPGPQVHIESVKMDFHYNTESRPRRLRPTSACSST
jgi:glucose-6-phosphate 1-dehydrogenase